MTVDPTYEERVSSRRTEALFVALALFFLLLLAWRGTATGLGILTVTFFCLFVFFLFYALNYRTLIIRMTSERLDLRFGIFSWTIPWDTVEKVYVDDISLWRIGGAGIHFTSIRSRYRVMFNFLEHPRVVVSLNEKRGLVWDVAFSTSRPKEVTRILRESIPGQETSRLPHKEM